MAGSGKRIDVLLVNPGSRAAVHQELGDRFSAIEPPSLAGLFDEDYFCYTEDIDLGFRLRLLGHRCYYVPDAVVLHKGSALTGRHSSFSIYHGHRNLTWTFIKNVPSPWLWLFLPLHIGICVVTLAWFASKGNGKAIWRAKVDAVKGLGGAWAKRRAIQAARAVDIGTLLPLMHFGLRRSVSDETPGSPKSARSRQSEAHT